MLSAFWRCAGPCLFARPSLGLSELSYLGVLVVGHASLGFGEVRSFAGGLCLRLCFALSAVCSGWGEARDVFRWWAIDLVPAGEACLAGRLAGPQTAHGTLENESMPRQP